MADIAVLNTGHIYRSMYSIATLVEMAKTLKLKERRTDVGVLYGLYQAAFWKTPPIAVSMDMKSKNNLRPQINKTAKSFMNTFDRKLYSGDRDGAFQYLAKLDKIGKMAGENIMSAQADMARINTEVANQLGSAARTTATIKMAATVSLAILGFHAGVLVATSNGLYVVGANATVSAGTQMTIFGLANGGTMTVAKSWSEAKSAGAIAIDTGGFLRDEAVKKLIETGVSAVVKGICGNTAEAAKELKMLRNVSQTMVQGQSKKMMQELIKKEGQKLAANTAASEFINGRLPVVFLGLDLMGAAREYEKDMKSI